MSWPRQFVFPAALNSAVIASIHAIALKQLPSTNDQTVDDSRVRYAEARWLAQDATTAFAYEMIRGLFLAANYEFNYALSAIREPLLYVSYPVGAHFTWHTDTGPGSIATRKLSVSILLSEPSTYDGGALEFCPGGGLLDASSMGTAIVFPSYMAHRITPVTRGVRTALVAWMHGTAFR